VEKTILSIDCGTQSLRTMLFNPEGGLLEKNKSYTIYPPLGRIPKMVCYLERNIDDRNCEL